MGNDLLGNPDLLNLVGRKLAGNLTWGNLAGTSLGNLVGRFSGEWFFGTEIEAENFVGNLVGKACFPLK